MRATLVLEGSRSDWTEYRWTSNYISWLVRVLAVV